MDPLRVAIAGVGRRGTGVWIPVTQALHDRSVLVAIANQGAPRGKEAADAASVPWYTDIEAMLDETQPHILVAAVNPPNRAIVSVPALERGISVIAETPIASTLEDTDRMIAAAKQSGSKLEVAENFYRTPVERLKNHMIQEGVFGAIWRTFNDRFTHNFHAVSILRSYIGFDVPIRRVTGWEQTASVAEHIGRGQPVNEERARHAVLEFEGGALGFHGFSSLVFRSPIRAQSRITGFYAEKGMAFGEELTLLTGTESSETLQVERKSGKINGQDILQSIHAGNWSWENPYFDHGVPENHVALASTLDTLITAIRDNGEPEYGARNGRVDREVDLAITESHKAGNVPTKI